MSKRSNVLDAVAEMPIADGQARIQTNSDLRAHLSHIAFRQHSLATSFLDTGNEHVAAQLFRWSQEIEAIVDKQRKAEGEELHDRLQVSQQHSVSLLEAAMAGVFL